MSTTIPHTPSAPATHAFSSDLAYDDSQPLDPSTNKKMWAIFGILAVCLTLGYWNMFEYTASFWQKDLYSHGWIVPVFAAFLLFSRAKRQTVMTGKEMLFSWFVGGLLMGIVVSAALSEESYPAWLIMIATVGLIGLAVYHLSNVQLSEVDSSIRWVGVSIIVVSFAVRLGAAYLDMNPLDRLSYIGCLLGIAMLVGGPELIRWAGLPLAFIGFMFPLPSILENQVLLRLQTVAATLGTWTLQMLGAPAMRDGNKLIVDQMPLDVAAACSGLRMATIFGAMSVALAILMVERPWWDRLFLVVSAIPVALATNVIRITITALLLMVFPENKFVKDLIHDWAGLAMMPIAMGILWLELEILRKISVPIDTDDYSAFGTING